MNANGSDMKKAAINKAKQQSHGQVSSTTSNTTSTTTTNGNKKRRKGGSDLKPIITAEGKSQDGSPASSVNSAKYSLVFL
jgi:hypothetical protein